MTALTPKAADHATLPPLASRFVDPANIPWEDTRFAGVRQKVLVVDRDSGVATVLIHMAPGAKLPDHEHVLLEQTYVLEGSLVCGEGECKAGEFVWRPAGSRHVAWCPQGGTMIAIFQVPNKFFETDGRVTDAGGKDWAASWQHVLSN